jgi:FimV-like protein
MLAPLDFDLGDLTLDLDGPPTLPAKPIPPELPPIDLGDLALDGDLTHPVGGDGRLSHQLNQAEELVRRGDGAGARPLLQEVARGATGALKADAQTLLDRLGAP